MCVCACDRLKERKSVFLKRTGTRSPRLEWLPSPLSHRLFRIHTESDPTHQFRPPVWAAQISESGEAPDRERGFTYELCAGLIDKAGLSPEEIAREEVKEECGYSIQSSAIRKVATYVHAAAHLGTMEHIFYAEVDESMRAGAGGGLSEDGEAIEVFTLPLEEARDFVLDPEYPKSAAAIIGIQWLVAERERALT